VQDDGQVARERDLPSPCYTYQISNVQTRKCLTIARDDVDLPKRTITIRRLKGSQDSSHYLERDEVAGLKALQRLYDALWRGVVNRRPIGTPDRHPRGTLPFYTLND
jgi:hypothetical protein